MARSTATFTVVVGDLPVTSSSPEMDWSRHHGGEAVQVRESGEGANERHERVPERVSVFIPPDGHGLGCTSVGRDWAPWAALWGGIVH
jgi:hypothetical protein